MILIYRTRPSVGAVRLAEELRGMGVEAKKISRIPRKVKEGTKVVCWGEEYTGLNSAPPMSKLAEVDTLVAAGVPTVTAVRTLAGLDRDDGWLGRTSNHVGGNDLLADYGFVPAYWVKKEEVVREYRLHIFRGVSIRAGRKEPYRGDHHPWIRSLNGGWHLVYDGRGVTGKHREVAKRAVEALGLDFGAVDVGERADSSVLVFEVNRAAGAEGNTVKRYAEKIKAWAEEVA